MIRKETTAGGMKIVAEQFNGIHDFLNMYEKREVSENYKNHSDAKELQNKEYDSYRRDFTGVSGYPEAVEQLKNGVNVNAIKAARTAAASGTKRMIKHSVNGGRVCVPTYLSGSPACMRRSVKMPTKTELNIVVDAGVTCSVRASQVTEAGKLIVEYITKLEERYNVNLHAVSSISFNRAKTTNKFKDAYIYGIKIKDAGKPFSAARVSFCLTSAAFLRVFGFIWLTRADGVPYDYCYGYPTSNNIEQEREAVGAIYKNSVLISLQNVIRKGEAALPKVK